MNDIAYFDNAATTFPKPEEVYTFTDRFYRECGVNVGRGQHKLATKASALVVETRQLLLDLNHCPAKKVVFTHTATEALNIILQGTHLPVGSNIYISPFEHNSVMRVLHHLNEDQRFNVITLAFDKANVTYDIEGIKHQFVDQKPNLVVLSHASNVCGVIAPISEICSLSKQHGSINVIDMCQTMGLLDTDLSRVDADYTVFAGHKALYAPFGVAGFICSSEVKLKPLLYGGTGVDSASRDLPSMIPEKYEVGSPNIMAIAGLNASLKWLNNTGSGKILKTEKSNHFRLLDLLMMYNNIKIISPEDGKGAIGVVSCVFDGYGSDNIGIVLSENNVAVRTGLHCAPDAHRFFGTFPSGTVRLSVSYFNTDQDFERLKNALDYIYINS